MTTSVKHFLSKSHVTRSLRELSRHNSLCLLKSPFVLVGAERPARLIDLDRIGDNHERRARSRHLAWCVRRGDSVNPDTPLMCRSRAFSKESHSRAARRCTRRPSGDHHSPLDEMSKGLPRRSTFPPTVEHITPRNRGATDSYGEYGVSMRTSQSIVGRCRP